MLIPHEEFSYVPKREKIKVMYTKLDTNYRHKKVHMHDRNEMLFITCDTEATIFSNGNIYTVKAPALVIHKAGSYHSTDTQNSADGTYSSYCIFFDTQYISQIPETLLHSRTILSNDCLIIPLTAEQCKKYCTYLELMKKEKGFHKKQLFLLLAIIDQTLFNLQSAKPVRLNNPNNYIFDVTQYIITHFNEHFTTAELAQMFYVSISKLNADFYKITNTTIKDFCTALRINKAAELLRDTEEPISKVAYSTGFSSESYLIQAFRRHMAMTPTAYRKKHR